MLSEHNQTTLNQALMVLMGLMAVAALSLLVKTFYMVRPQPTSVSEHSITLTATGDAVGIPDVARISLSVLQEGDTVEAATADGNKKMTEVMNKLKEAGIKDEDLKTIAYNLTPRYNYDVQPYKIEKYQLDQTVDVTVRDFEKLGSIVEAATAAGANSVGSPRFEIDDPETIKSEARAEALANVKQRIEDLADNAGVRVGEMINFTEQDPSSSTPTPYAYDTTRALGESTTIQPGNQTVSVQVSVTYAIR